MIGVVLIYLIARQEVGENIRLWLKYDVNQRPSDLNTLQSSRADQESKAFGAVRQGFHAQLDYKW